MPERPPPLLSARSAISQRLLGGVAERLGLALGAALLGDLVELGLGALDLGQRRDFLADVSSAPSTRSRPTPTSARSSARS